MSDNILQNRFKDLASRSYHKNVYTYTGFLSLADISDFYAIEKELSYASYTLFGGNDACERKVLRFGSESLLGYDEPFPIVCLQIKPLNSKFADDLNHRDFLGALMNLGIERETLGDIFICENATFLFCLASISDYISENLYRIRHTSVSVTKADSFCESFSVKKVPKQIQVASNRCDAVIAHTFNLSRNDVLELFQGGKVFVNSRLFENNSAPLKAADIISVRGYGKFEFDGETGLSKKGKLNVQISQYF